MTEPAAAPRRIRTYHDVADPGAEDVLQQVTQQQRRLTERLGAIGAIVLVASGKGGVGKSAVTANLAAALASRGRAVGAADADLNGPSLARMLGAPRQALVMERGGVRPVPAAAGVSVMSMDLLLQDDGALRWRGSQDLDFLRQSLLEGGALREFLADTEWGRLDYLLIDAPPGSDKLIRVAQLVPRVDVLLLVSSPAEISRSVVARSARLVCDLRIGRTAIVGNMTHAECEACGHVAALYPGDGVRRLARETDLPLWAEIPFDARLAGTTDLGRPFVLERPDAPAARALLALADRIDSLHADQPVPPTAGTAP